MKRNKQQGFSVVIVIVLLAVAAVIALVALRMSRNQDVRPTSQNNQQSNDTGKKAASADPNENLVLKNLGLESLTKDVEVTTNATRDFTASGHKGFYVFGDKLPGTPVRLNPNYEYASVRQGAPVIAALDGVVVFVREQPDSKDYEVFLSPRENSRWVVGYDHLVDLTVKKGDSVRAGDKLGVPAKQNNGLLRFELQINRDDNTANPKHVCPSTLLDPSVKDQLLADLTAMQNSWEKTTGLELYDPASQKPVGCTYDELTPAQAEGRS